MECPNCGSENFVSGIDDDLEEYYECKDCKYRLSDVDLEDDGDGDISWIIDEDPDEFYEHEDQW